MQQFAINETSYEMILTLTEKQTLVNPNYLFVFTNATTKSTIKFVKLNSDDESLFKTRYNQFTIDPSVVFNGQNTGDWFYQVYEQESTTNTDPTNLNELENGKVIIDRATEFSYTQYNQQTIYKAYAG